MSTQMVHDWSSIRVESETDATDADTRRLLVENTRLTGRLMRLGPAMASMAHDLARIRRENVALKRENQRLRSLLHPSGESRHAKRLPSLPPRAVSH